MSYLNRGIIAVAALFSISNHALASTSAVDITPLFSGIETDCASNNKLAGAVANWLSPKNGKIKPAFAAPTLLRPALARTSIKNNGDSWTTTATLNNAVYKALPVERIEKWTGKDNGINGYTLIFKDSLAVVSQRLKVAKPDPSKEGTQPTLMRSSAQGKSAALMCDFSD